jgi:hypothetical protein
MEWLAKWVVLLIAGWVIWGLWRAGRPQRVFVVRITDGKPQAITGTVTAAFLQRVREVAAEHGVKTGQVWGLARGARISLGFSRQITAPACQQVRNWWAVSGWSAGRNRASA